MVHKKSIGPLIQKYIIKKNITDLTESYSNPKKDKKPIPIAVEIQNAMINKKAKNKNIIANSKK